MIWALNDPRQAQAPHVPPHAQWYRSPLPLRQRTRPATLSMCSAPCPCRTFQPAMAVVEDAILNTIKLCAKCYYFSCPVMFSSLHFQDDLVGFVRPFAYASAKQLSSSCNIDGQNMNHSNWPSLTHLQCCSTNVLSLPAWERLHAAQTFHPFHKPFQVSNATTQNPSCSLWQF